MSRVIGLLLLVLLIWHIDVRELYSLASVANARLVVAVILLNIPLVYLKAWRWCVLLQSQRIQYGMREAVLSYFGSIFIGLLTPGRIGEFAKALHVSQDCSISTGRAFSSVLTDRIFDLSVVFLVGGAALVSLVSWWTIGYLAGFLVFGVLLLISLAFLFFNNTWSLVLLFDQRFRSPGKRFSALLGWCRELRSSIRELTVTALIIALAITILAYSLFFAQCYLLAIALHLPLGIVTVSYAVALGSIVTLLPISISGLGTREAAIIAYLSTAGVTAEASLSFSLLVFVAFYLAGGLMGAVAWWIKPVSLKLTNAKSKSEYL